ncbi:helix-turn-helix domain-containing protein [Desulfocurvibacter africanus]|uniref:DNA-binding protein n=1 Tax=Desulfocurvibacter africanus subsp. africanus str. Walvis Bay TaxID=690850 RepID=F3YY81_DESAF|nr:helix-turn-helix domain-containing protein [Desulfocurvibacter africanus]EGJ51857.1 DNA-binding protein [Desulfocurvibacter africanus subsp. africanus str. Walvis Bay]
MSQIIDMLLKVLGAGYQPYQGHIEPDAYTRLTCQNPERSRWFARELQFICLGCSRACAVVNPSGFQLVLPVSARKRAKSCFANLPLVSADQLLRTKLLLRVDEAAFVLNISEREIRNYVDEGKLTAHPDAPLRVTADSVRQCLRGRAA